MTTPYDARTALSAIRHRQEQTFNEYMRHAGSRPHLTVSALGLFAVCASFDLPSPLNTVAVLVGNALILGGLFAHRRSAPVRRKPAASEVVLFGVMGVLMVVLFWTAAIAAWFLGLPARHTIAAAVTALATVAASYALRPFVENMIRGNGRG